MISRESILDVLESIADTCRDNQYCDGNCPYYNHSEDECSFKYAPDAWHLDEI